MALPYPINSSQTDCLSPLDDQLMDAIREDLEYLDTLLSLGTNIFTWNVNGSLIALDSYKGAVDTTVNYKQFTPTKLKVAMKKSGTSGSAKFDILKHTLCSVPITAIAHEGSFSTQAIARVGSSLATQSIAQHVSTISTQSISRAKSAQNVQSIINVGGNLWRYNFSAPLDDDWNPKNDRATVIRNFSGTSLYATFAGCTAGGNNGTFAILEVNQSGYGSIVVSNASGVAQTSAAGTAELCLWSYNQLNPIDTNFLRTGNVSPTYFQCTFAAHTTGANNGAFIPYKINQSGNNIWVYNQTGAAQAGVAGTVNPNLWRYNYLSSVDTTHYVATEFATFASHSSGANNGGFLVWLVNDSGNNIVVYNDSGTAQAGVAGNAQSLRWIIAATSPMTGVIGVGDYVILASHTNPANDGEYFSVKLVDTAASNNIVIYNVSGVAQAGVAGTVATWKKIVSFSTDQSALFTTDSYVQFSGCPDGDYNVNPMKFPYEVFEVNKGGGSNYNIIIEEISGGVQLSPAGFVIMEAKSIFDSELELEADTTSLEGDMWIGDEYTNFVGGAIEDGKLLGFYFKEMMLGDPEDFSAVLY